MNDNLNVNSGSVSYAAEKIHNYNVEIDDTLNNELHKRIDELEGSGCGKAKRNAVYKFECICSNLLDRRYNEIDRAALHLKEKVADKLDEDENKILNNLTELFNP